MNILALDLAEYMIGVALGEAGLKPRVDLFKLRKDGMTTEAAVAEFGAWLHAKLHYQIARKEPVDLVVAENYIPAGALKGFTTSDTRDGQILLNGALRGVCGMLAIPVRCPRVQTIRKHFVANGFADKTMVMRQAKLLGYLPRDLPETGNNFNLSDAVALWDFASSRWGKAAGVFELTSVDS